MTHPLLKYRKETGESCRAIAVKARTTAATVSRICRYEQTPSVDLIRRLVAATGGQVSVEDFVGVAE